MEHAVNLAAGHFMQAIILKSSSQADREEEDFDEEGVSASDALVKALALITQVCKTS